MNDKIIINIISKTYFSIVSFFIFISLLLLIVFIVLQNGVFIKKLHVLNIQVKELYIKWDKKVDLSIKEINVSKSKSKKNYPINYKEISNYIKYTSYAIKLFNSIIIEKISSQEVIASFKYKNNENGFFIAKSQDVDANVSISFKDNVVDINIDSIYDKKRDIFIDGNLYFDTDSFDVYSNITTKIANEATLNIYAKFDTNRVDYKIFSKKDIKSITNIINIIDPPQHIRYWAYDAILMSKIEIKHIDGYLEYKDLSNVYKNIKIYTLVKNLNYKYNKKLASISSSSTEIDFLNGILYIKPNNAYTYGMFLDKSWLKIDFTNKEELLTLHLLFNGVVNKDILNILNAYKIKLPFIQNSGKVKTDLTLAVGLQNLDVDAKGEFFTKEANIDYLGINLDVYNTHVLINNNDITIDKMQANYKNMAKADVFANYNAKSKQGKISFKLNSIEKNGLSLKNPINVFYNVYPNRDNIVVDNSVWTFKSNDIYINKLSVPFNINELKINIPDTFIEVNSNGSAFVSGIVNLNNMSATLDANILNFSYDGVELSQPNTPIKIQYDKKLLIESTEEILFEIVGTQYKADKILLEINDNDVRLKHTNLNIGKYISTKLYANYNTKTKLSHISLNNFTLVDPNTNNLLYKNKKMLLLGYVKDDTIKINSEKLGADFSSKESGWRLNLHSIEKISKNSDLLKGLKLKDGTFTVYKNKKDNFTRFKSKIIYPYKVLVKNNIPIDKYSIKGKIYKNKVDMLINDSVNVKIKDKISLEAKHTAINIDETLRALKEINATSKKPLELIAKVKDSYLYISKNSKVIYDRIDLNYVDKTLEIKLDYKKAHASLKIKNKKFNLYGRNFNDNFMTKLFSISKFKNGTLNFFASGDIDDYSGVFYVKNTILKDYKLLNNVLAFVNTIPSLITFSLPGYNKDGLFAKESYVNFHYKNKKFHISDIYLDSKEMDIVGNGTADMKNDYLDLVLNLQTDLGSGLSKIPLVGYILLNGNSISTTLSVKGKISDPEVTSLIAKEIVVAPFNIIKRTLLLPYKLIKDAN